MTASENGGLGTLDLVIARLELYTLFSNLLALLSFFFKAWSDLDLLGLLQCSELLGRFE